jgi:transposase InsO family protein
MNEDLRRETHGTAVGGNREQIDALLAVGVGENPRESLSELARLGARLIIQRAVEDEFDAWLRRARYERRPDYRRGLRERLRHAQEELVRRRTSPTRRELIGEVSDYIGAFYNADRRHSTLGYLFPAQFELRASSSAPETIMSKENTT